MAFEIQRINPIDLDSSKAVGVKLPFDGKAVFNLNYTTKDAIKPNLTNFLLTGRGERYLNPSFGSDFRNILFNPIVENLAQEIESTVASEMSIYFPQIEVTQIQVDAIERLNTLQFSMTYSIRDTNVDDSLTINLENPRFS